MMKIQKSEDGEVKFNHMETNHGTIDVNIWKEGNLIVINKIFRKTGFRHHLQLTIEEFEAIKALKME